MVLKYNARSKRPHLQQKRGTQSSSNAWHSTVNRISEREVNTEKITNKMLFAKQLFSTAKDVLTTKRGQSTSVAEISGVVSCEKLVCTSMNEVSGTWGFNNYFTFNIWRNTTTVCSIWIVGGNKFHYHMFQLPADFSTNCSICKTVLHNWIILEN